MILSLEIHLEISYNFFCVKRTTCIQREFGIKLSRNNNKTMQCKKWEEIQKRPIDNDLIDSFFLNQSDKWYADNWCIYE